VVNQVRAEPYFFKFRGPGCAHGGRAHFGAPHPMAPSTLAASQLKSPKLSNLLLRLSDFASAVEGNRAMKSGDIGRIMNMWRKWSFIAIGVKKLCQYSIQLPRMIILINNFSSQAKDAASQLKSPKLSNLLLRLSDFASVVKGNRAMKSGDIGRIMNMWRRWSVIAIGVKKLCQYSIQIPHMII
jgi:hypothetical protein